MKLAEYCGYDAVGLAELLDDREITAKELAELAISAVEAVNPALNAVIESYPERVEAIDGSPATGPLLGVPFFLKDLGPTEVGKKCEWGSRISAGAIATSDTALTIKIREAGLNILGRTTCPEFGFAVSTESVLNGITRNPWNPDRTPGGSSGGSAAIVAAGAMPMAHANDGAGSTRVPASMSGLVGLKCSRGRISLGPDCGDVQFPLYSEFVVTRSVRDTAVALEALSGQIPGEMTLYSEPAVPFSQEAKRHCEQLRIALSTDPWGRGAPSVDVADEIRRIGKLLLDMGHTVEEATPPIDFNEFHEVFGNFFSMVGMAEVDNLARTVGCDDYISQLENVSRRLYEHGQTFGVKDYIAALATMNKVSRQLGEFYNDYDLLLTPTVAIPTPLADELKLNREISIDEYYAELFAAAPYTPLNNFTGTPAISLPLCETADGMPLGAHFMAPMGEEARLLRMAAGLEQAAPWSGRRPSVHVCAEGLPGLTEHMLAAATSKKSI